MSRSSCRIWSKKEAWRGEAPTGNSRKRRGGAKPRQGTLKEIEPMRSGVIAQKVGMTRVYNDAGEHVPVTVLRMENCQVVAQRTQDKNGYTAVQLGVGLAKVKNTPKAMRGHFAAASVEPKAKVAEFR